MLADTAHAQRLLALTGLGPEELRARLGDPALLAGVLNVLLNYEPDLIACADALGVEPMALAAAYHHLAPSEDSA